MPDSSTSTASIQYPIFGTGDTVTSVTIQTWAQNALDALNATNVTSSVIPTWHWTQHYDMTPAVTTVRVLIEAVQNAMYLPTGQGGYFFQAVSGARPSPAGWLPTRPRPLARPAIIAGRRALRRSIDLFRMLRPAEELKTFLDGHPLTIHGHRFDYRVQKRMNLLEHSINPRTAHIPYDLQLVDKTTGRNIAKGCVIIPETPVIDQVLALILNVSDPAQEIVMVNTTNWSPGLPAIARARLRDLPLAA